MIWREPTNHHDDCYVVNMKGFNRYKKSKWEDSDLKSATLLISHGDDVPIPVYMLPDVSLSDIEDTQDLGCNKTGDRSLSEYEENISTLQQFAQAELNDLVWNFNLS